MATYPPLALHIPPTSCILIFLYVGRKPHVLDFKIGNLDVGGQLSNIES